MLESLVKVTCLLLFCLLSSFHSGDKIFSPDKLAAIDVRGRLSPFVSTHVSLPAIVTRTFERAIKQCDCADTVNGKTIDEEVDFSRGRQ